MTAGDIVALWLEDTAAKLFLGLLDEHHRARRWVVIGTVASLEAGIGVWIDVEYVEQRTSGIGDAKARRLRYEVNPSRCLIRWDYVITAQILKDAANAPDDPKPLPRHYL